MFDAINNLEGLKLVDRPPRVETESGSGRAKGANQEPTTQTAQASTELDQALTFNQLAELEQELDSSGVTVKIKFDRETGSNQVQVVDRDTGEVIRQIPPEELVRLKANVEKMIGIFLDREV